MPASSPATAEQAIRQAFQDLVRPGQQWVSLTQVRERLPQSLSREEVDIALRHMNRQPGINIAPQSNQKVLTQADRAAMVQVGNEQRLLLSIRQGA